MNAEAHRSEQEAIILPSHIRALIRARISTLDENQTQVGQWIGLTQPRFNEVPKGKRGMTREALRLLANKLESRELRQYADSVGIHSRPDFDALMQTLREALEAMPRRDQQEVFLATALLFEAKMQRGHSKVSEILRIFSNLISGDEVNK